MIAVSGAYDSGDQVPGGVIADAFYSKGRHRPRRTSAYRRRISCPKVERAIDHHRQSAPVWIPRNGKDSNGVPFIVLTCTHCLRSFPLSITGENVQEIQETPCLFCAHPVRYVIDFSVDVASPNVRVVGGAHVAVLVEANGHRDSSNTTAARASIPADFDVPITLRCLPNTSQEYVDYGDLPPLLRPATEKSPCRT